MTNFRSMIGMVIKIERALFNVMLVAGPITIIMMAIVLSQGFRWDSIIAAIMVAPATLLAYRRLLKGI